MSKIPRHFVPILRWISATQTKTCFLTFVTKLKIEDHMFPFFPFLSSLWRNCHKIEGHHSIENTEFIYSYFFEIITENTVPYVSRLGNCRFSAPCLIIFCLCANDWTKCCSYWNLKGNAWGLWWNILFQKSSCRFSGS